MNGIVFKDKSGILTLLWVEENLSSGVVGIGDEEHIYDDMGDDWAEIVEVDDLGMDAGLYYMKSLSKVQFDNNGTFCLACDAIMDAAHNAPDKLHDLINGKRPAGERSQFKGNLPIREGTL